MGGHTTREAPRFFRRSTDKRPKRGAGSDRRGLLAAPRPPPDEAPRRAFGPGAAGGARADAPPLADGERGGPRGKRRHRARGRRSREDGAGYTHRQAPLARSAPAGLTGRLWRPGQRRPCGAFAAPKRKAASGGGARTETRVAAAGGDEPGSAEESRSARRPRARGRSGAKKDEGQAPRTARRAGGGNPPRPEDSGGTLFARSGGDFSRHLGQRHVRGAE